MALDEREYIRSRKRYRFTDKEKTRRLEEMRERLEQTTPRDKRPIVLREIIKTRPVKGSGPAWIVIALALAVSGTAFYQYGPEIAAINQKREATSRPASPLVIRPPLPPKPKAMKMAEAKEIYWHQYFRDANDCITPVTPKKAAECRKQRETKRASFEKEWAASIAAGWHPPEAK